MTPHAAGRGNPVVRTAQTGVVASCPHRAMVSRGGGEHVSRTEECPLPAVLSRQDRHVPLSAGTLAVTRSSSPGRWASIAGHCASHSADKTGEWGKPVWPVMLHEGEAAREGGSGQLGCGRSLACPGGATRSPLFPFQNHPGGCSVLWSAFPGHCWSTGHGWFSSVGAHCLGWLSQMTTDWVTGTAERYSLTVLAARSPESVTGPGARC